MPSQCQVPMLPTLPHCLLTEAAQWLSHRRTMGSAWHSTEDPAEASSPREPWALPTSPSARGSSSHSFFLFPPGIPPIQPERKMGKCCPDLPLSMLPGEGSVVLASNKSGRWGGKPWPGAHMPSWHCQGRGQRGLATCSASW